MSTRIETDSLGAIQVPSAAYWGAHTARAIDNFPITGVPVSSHPHLVVALAQVKHAAALANEEAGCVSPTVARAIIAACRLVESNEHHDQFCIDVIQGGAGTSTNMNANEVIANLALESLGYDRARYDMVSPIDHVNRCQSTNDVYPTAVKVALIAVLGELSRELGELSSAFANKGREFCSIPKIGRTQLQDAVPMTMGHEFTAMAVTLAEEVPRLGESMSLLGEVNLGGTAIGTGITAEPAYRESVVRHLRAVTGLALTPATDLIESTSDTGVFMHVSATMKRSAIKLSKTCSDLRLLSSGPQTGFAEINLPPRQAGSSIMPGKVNPVIPEVVNQIAFAAVGADVTVSMAADNGQLQLNAFEPIIAHTLLSTARWLTRGCHVLRRLCVDGITANMECLTRQTVVSTGAATALSPHVGYAAATKLAKLALATGESVADVAERLGLLDRDTVEQIIAEAAAHPGG